MEIAIIGVALLFFLGHGLNWFFIKTKIPDLLILVILGYLLGPTLGIVSAEDFGQVGNVVATIALIVILYEGGLHLSARDLMQSSLPAAGLSILGFALIVAFGAIFAFGVALQPWTVALLLGIGIGSTSSAIVIPMVKPLSIGEKTKSVLSLESAFTDVLTIVIFLVITDAVASGLFSFKELIVGVGPKTVSALLMGIFAALVWAFVKKRFAPLLKMAFAGEAFALLTYGAIEFFDHNGAIGVLALGFTLANLDLLPSWLKKQMSSVPVTYNDMSLLSEITFLLRTFFFIYLGLLITFSSLDVVAFALLISLGIFLTRYITVRLIFKPADYSRLEAMTAVAMGPRGLACAVLATLPLSRGIEGGEWLQNTMFAIIPISILFTAVFVSLTERPGFRLKLAKLFNAYEEGVDQPLTSSEGEPSNGSN